MIKYLVTAVLVSVVVMHDGIANAQCGDNTRLHGCDLPFRVWYLSDAGQYCDAQEVIQLIQEAVDLWNNAVPWGTVLEFMGTTDNEWINCGNWTEDGPNFLNQIVWRSSGVVGTTFQYERQGFDDLEKDIVLSKEHVTCIPKPGEPIFDALYVVTHELGHILGLQDNSRCDGSVMAGMGLFWEEFSGELADCDITQIRTLYPLETFSNSHMNISNVITNETFSEDIGGWDVDFIFDTNLSATSQILYDKLIDGMSCSYSQAEFGPEEVSHSITLSGLEPGATYCYDITAASYSEEANCLPSEQGTIVLDDVAQVSAFMTDGENSFPLPDTFATGCPLGDGEHLVIDLTFDPSYITRDIQADELSLSAPQGGNIVLYWGGESVNEADSAATAENGYHTTITQRYFGGCGEDVVSVLLNGAPVGEATIAVKSPDYDTDGSSYGRVNLQDIAAFSTHYTTPPQCSGDPGYDDCFDFILDGSPSCINGDDYAVITAHIYHTFPYLPGGVSAIVDNPAITLDFKSAIAGAGGKTPAEYEMVLRATNGANTTGAPEAASLQMIVWAAVTLACQDGYCDIEYRQKSDFPGVITVIRTRMQTGSAITIVANMSRPLSGDRIDLGVLELGSSTQDVADKPELLYGEVLSADGVTSRIDKTSVHEIPNVVGTQLEQNVPNPFNPNTTIAYSISDTRMVDVSVYDAAGHLVRTLVKETKSEGRHSVSWDGRDNDGRTATSGVYFVRLEAGSEVLTRKIVLLK
jgi:hypothetical protein